MKLTIANITKSIDDTSFSSVIDAIVLQVSRDFQSEWGTNSTITGTRLSLQSSQVELNAATDAIIYFGDSSQDPTTGVTNVYGYHSANFNHIPYGFVYLDVCQKYDEPWSCTLSHETLELLADPTAVQTVSGPAPGGAGGTVYYDLEVCDPTQSDTYLIGGVSVSNFVMKSYFGIPGGSPNTNFLNLALKSFQARPLGYFQYEDNAGSHQVNGSAVGASRIEARKILGEYRRNARRTARLEVSNGLKRPSLTVK